MRYTLPAVALVATLLLAATLFAGAAPVYPMVKWEALDGSTDPNPVIENGVMYYAADGVVARNLTTGEQLWTFDSSRSTYGEPIGVYNGTVYAIFRSTGFGSRPIYRTLYAVNATTGIMINHVKLETLSNNVGGSAAAERSIVVQSERWSKDNEYHNKLTIFDFSSDDTSTWVKTEVPTQLFVKPILHGNVIIASTSDDSFDGRRPVVLALDAGNGTKNWEKTLEGGTHEYRDVITCVGSGRVFSGFGDKFYAFDIATGDTVWNTTLKNRFDRGSCVVEGDKLVISDSDGFMYGFNVSTFSELFDFRHYGGGVGKVALRGDVLYGTAYRMGDAYHTAYALDTTTLKFLFEYSSVQFDKGITLADDFLVGSSPGIIALNATYVTPPPLPSAAEMWKVDTQKKIVGDLLAAGGNKACYLIENGTHGTLVARSADTGAEVTVTLVYEVTGIQYADYVAASDGSVYVVTSSSGYQPKITIYELHPATSSGIVTSHAMDDLALASSGIAVAMAGSTLVISCTKKTYWKKIHYLVAWDVGDWTKRKWTRGSVAGELFVVDDVVVAAGETTTAVNITTGNKVWDYATEKVAAMPGCGGDGRVFVADTSGMLHALDKTTGVMQWKAQIKASNSETWAQYTTCVVAHGRVYISWGTGPVRAFNATTGAVEWAYELEYSNVAFKRRYATGPMVVHDGLVCFRGQEMYCLDVVTGQLEWQSQIDAYSGPVAVGGRVIFGGMSTRHVDKAVIAAVDLPARSFANVQFARGDWQSSQGYVSKMYGAPVYAAGQVYVNGNGRVAALDASTGVEQWSIFEDTTWQRYPASVAASQGSLYTVYKGDLYVLNKTTGGTIKSMHGDAHSDHPLMCLAGTLLMVLQYKVYESKYCVDAYNMEHDRGSVVWRSNSLGTSADPPLSLTVHDGAVIVTRTTTTALNISTGYTMWQYTAPGNVEVAPCSDRGIVFFGDTTGVLYALSLATGAKIWKLQLASHGNTQCVVGDGIVYAANQHTLFALNASGAIQWSFHVPASFGRIALNLLYHEGTLIFSTNGGLVAAVDVTTQKLWWRYAAASAATTGGITVADGRVFFSDGVNAVTSLLLPPSPETPAPPTTTTTTPTTIAPTSTPTTTAPPSGGSAANKQAKTSTNLSGAAKGGIAAGGAVVVVALAVVYYCMRHRRQQPSYHEAEQELV